MILTLYISIIAMLVISGIQYESRVEQVQPKSPSKSGNFYRSSAWRKLRYEVLKFYEATCMCCGASRETGAQIHVDHILPRSLYEDLALEFSNMQVLCQDCNLAKNNTDETDWR